MSKMYRKQSGRSMIEMLGVLAIVGVLSAGGIAGYTMAMSTFKANKAMEMIQMVSTQIKTLYGQDFTGLSIGDLYNMNAISTEFLNTARDAGLSPFNTDFTVSEGEDATTYTLKIASVPKQACVKMVQSFWGDDTFFVGLKVGAGGNGKEFTDTTENNLAAALTACPDDTQDIEWEFK